jgi:hypothetical protein
LSAGLEPLAIVSLAPHFCSGWCSDHANPNLGDWNTNVVRLPRALSNVRISMLASSGERIHILSQSTNFDESPLPPPKTGSSKPLLKLPCFKLLGLCFSTEGAEMEVEESGHNLATPSAYTGAPSEATIGFGSNHLDKKMCDCGRQRAAVELLWQCLLGAFLMAQLRAVL